MSRLSICIASTALALGFSSSSVAQPVNITGTIGNSCILSITSNGVLASAPDGRSISSTQSGGSPGTFTLVAAGTAPRVRFTAPALETPTGFSGTPATMIRYTSQRGANQDWTVAASQATAGALLDSFTVHGRVENEAGFVSGRYNVQTVVTCEQ